MHIRCHFFLFVRTTLLVIIANLCNASCYEERERKISDIKPWLWNPTKARKQKKYYATNQMAPSRKSLIIKLKLIVSLKLVSLSLRLALIIARRRWEKKKMKEPKKYNLHCWWCCSTRLYKSCRSMDGLQSFVNLIRQRVSLYNFFLHLIII